MGDRKKPDTTEEMIQQIWYAVWGANGDGVAEISKQNRNDIKEIKAVLPELITRTEHLAYHDGLDEKERRQRWRRTDVVIAGGVLVTAALTLVTAAFTAFQAVL